MFFGAVSFVKISDSEQLTQLSLTESIKYEFWNVSFLHVSNDRKMEKKEGRRRRKEESCCPSCAFTTLASYHSRKEQHHHRRRRPARRKEFRTPNHSRRKQMVGAHKISNLHSPDSIVTRYILPRCYFLADRVK